MAYVKITNFAIKDSTNAIIRGTEHDDEYNAISTAIGLNALKGANSDITSLTGLTTPLSVAQGGTGITSFGTSIATWLGTPSSANLISAITDETGTGNLVFSTSPTLVTPVLGTPTSGTLTSCTGLPISTGVSGLGTGVATFLGTPSSANLASAITDETGTGALVFGTTPTLTGIKETKTTTPAHNFDLSTGNYFTYTLSGAQTLTVSNTATTGSVSTFILDITNGGSAVITWWSGMKWASGTAPTLTTSGRDILGFFTHDGGTTWNGLVLAKAMA